MINIKIFLITILFVSLTATVTVTYRLEMMPAAKKHFKAQRTIYSDSSDANDLFDGSELVVYLLLNFAR